MRGASWLVFGANPMRVVDHCQGTSVGRSAACRRGFGYSCGPMDVQVKFLGTGGPFASGGRLQTCILISTEQRRYLVDCGMTALVAMARFGIDPGSIDAVLVTHLHGDHYGGL